MVKAQVETKELPHVEDGVYDAIFQEVEEIDTKFGKKWRWVFRIPRPDGFVDVSGLTSPTFSRKGKAYKWACAIAKKTYKEGEEIDTDNLRGRHVLIETATVPYGDTVISNVVNVMRPPTKTQKGKKGGKA